MAYHKLLQRQLKKYCTDEMMEQKAFTQFIDAVSDSYNSFDRDKELSDHAFVITEQEFSAINRQLKDEFEIKKKSIRELSTALSNLKTETTDFQAGNENDDILEIVSLINQEIDKRKAAELQLVAAKEEAEKASLAKSEFLSIMSHEIRTPLNAVIGMGHLLLRDNPRPDQLGNLKALKTSAHNLLVLINDILDFNKIEAGKLDFEEAVFSVRKLVTDIVTANTNAAEEHENRILLQMAENLPENFIGDSVRLGQVLNNLVSNAVKFTQCGVVTITVQLLQLEGDKAVLNFSIKDTGVGIAAEKLSNIFLPFTQASSAITRQFGGTGLGLAITKRILNLLQSDITVESLPGKGSSFGFNLQLKTTQQAIISFDNEQSPEFDLRGKRILLVEDTLFNVMFATQLLEGWNAKTEVADNGLEAVNMLQKGQYDLVLMDLQMPVMDGYTATIKIREFNSSIPIIALTASATNNVREKVMIAGMQDYVTKPFNPDDFYLKLKKYL